MEAAQLSARVTERYPDVVCAVDPFGVVTADVPTGDWVGVATFARDELGCTFFDWLSAVDQGDGEMVVVAHLWSIAGRHHLMLRTRVSADGGSVPTLTGVFRGAAWHERETAEMFGLTFPGHPHPAPLLLPEEFEGHPLRKDFVLASRVAKTWPGAQEPGEPDHDAAPSRRRVRPPGKPDPDEWRAAAAQRTDPPREDA